MNRKLYTWQANEMQPSNHSAMHAFAAVDFATADFATTPLIKTLCGRKVQNGRKDHGGGS